MQQEPYFYPSGTEIPSDSRLQYPNPYLMQPTMGAWPNNFTPSNMSANSGLYSGSSPSLLQCNQEPSMLTPVSTAMYGTTATYSWAHTVPSLMPWVPKPEITPPPDPIVRFSAPFPPDPCTSQTATSWELLHNLGANKPNPNLHLKRKSDLDIVDATPPKLCITEEKMAARFREMHISNQYTVSVENPMGSISNDPNFPSTEKSVTNLQQLEIVLQDNNCSDLNSKSLILAPELKKLVEPEKILSTFLNKMLQRKPEERPSMALVVWEPPKNKLHDGSETQKENSKVPESDTMENNNNVMPQQLNALCQQYLLSQANRENQSQVMAEDSMDT